MLAEFGGEHIALSFSLSIATLTTVVTLVWRFIKFRDWLLTVQRKVDTMWEAQLLRGRVEGEFKGHMIFPAGRQLTDDSFKLSLSAYERFKPIISKLRLLVLTSPTLGDQDLSLLIERHFGKWIIENVCRPLHLADMSCLVMAVALARQTGHASEIVKIRSDIDNSTHGIEP